MKFNIIIRKGTTFLKKSINLAFEMYVSLVHFKTLRPIFNCHLTCGIVNLIHKRLRFPHPIGIVLGKYVKIGNDCVIYQNVTIGAKNTENYRNAKYPILKDSVTVYPNSCIIGSVVVGKGAVVGANSLVITDVPAYAVVAGSPARILRTIRE